jgi:hypothetical protein
MCFSTLQHNCNWGITYRPDTATHQGAEPQCGLAPGTTSCNVVWSDRAHGGLCCWELQGVEDLGLHLGASCWHLCLCHISYRVLQASGTSVAQKNVPEH